jgi:hypothetical protein
MKLTDLKEGQFVKVDSGFSCMKEGVKKVYQNDKGFYVLCSHGKHYLDGQEDEKGSDLVGVDWGA